MFTRIVPNGIFRGSARSDAGEGCPLWSTIFALSHFFLHPDSCLLNSNIQEMSLNNVSYSLRRAPHADRKIRRLTRLRSTAADMGVVAAKAAIERAAVPPEEVEIIFGNARQAGGARTPPPPNLHPQRCAAMVPALHRR